MDSSRWRATAIDVWSTGRTSELWPMNSGGASASGPCCPTACSISRNTGGGGGDQTFRSPTEYPTLALVTVGTHDLPTFGGYCLARNIDVRARLGVFPDAHGEASQRRHRVADLDRLAQALNEEGLRFSQQTDGETGMPADEFATAAHAFLARSPAKLMAVQIEDLLGETDQANVPGTDREHPNWRRKLPIKISEWESREPLNAIVNAVVEERGKTQR